MFPWLWLLHASFFWCLDLSVCVGMISVCRDVEMLDHLSFLAQLKAGGGGWAPLLLIRQNIFREFGLLEGGEPWFTLRWFQPSIIKNQQRGRQCDVILTNFPTAASILLAYHAHTILLTRHPIAIATGLSLKMSFFVNWWSHKPNKTQLVHVRDTHHSLNHNP